MFVSSPRQRSFLAMAVLQGLLFLSSPWKRHPGLVVVAFTPSSLSFSFFSATASRTQRFSMSNNDNNMMHLTATAVGETTTRSLYSPPQQSPTTAAKDDTNDDDAEEVHPAVACWPEKYAANHGPTAEQQQQKGEEPIGPLSPQSSSSQSRGPRPLHSVLTVEPATEYQKYQLDVDHWPVWTTSDKPKWAVGNQNADKIMPYNELSYVLQGKLEIIPTTTSSAAADDGDETIYIVQPGDFVTFPKGFQASWRVLEELTWHYYLY